MLSYCLSILLPCVLCANVVAAREEVYGTHPVDSVITALLDSAQYYMVNNPKKALIKINEAMRLARQKHDRHSEAMAQVALGEYHFRLSNYAYAVEQGTLALRTAESLGDTLVMAFAHRLLGLVYTLGLKYYDKALSHQLQANALFKVLKNPAYIAANCGNLSWIYAITGQQLQTAHRIANQGIQLADSLQQPQLLSYNHNSKALIYKAQQRFDSALHHFEMSNHAARQANDKAVYAYNLALMGETALQTKKPRQAWAWFKESLDISAQIKLREVMKDCYKGLAEAAVMLGDTGKAYQYFNQHIQLKDSLVNWEVTQRTLLANQQLEDERKAKQLAMLELRTQRVQREQLLISIGFAIVFVLMATVLLLALRNNQHRKLSNKALHEKNLLIQEQNQKLLQAANLRDKLFSVISHDLRSPLASLRGLLNLLQQNQITEKEFRLLAPRLNRQLLGINETLENLLGWGHAQLGLHTYSPEPLAVNRLVERVFGLFVSMAENKNIVLVNQTDESLHLIADRNVLELVLRNLIHNAIKFSKPGGTVVVTAGTLPANGECYIEVTDTGQGVPENLIEKLAQGHVESRRGTEGEKGTGLGLLLCSELLGRQGGRLEATNRAAGGASFRVWLRQLSNTRA
jgi:signal transduction histidine kinase